MIAFKCKLCGGNLNIEEDKRIADCQYCGSTLTLPNLNNNKKNTLLIRANQLRQNNEFDKAMGIFETSLIEDHEDPEVFWSLVLCKYGVEYVEDPKTKERIITCHRTLVQSVLSDVDYKQAYELASLEAKKLYQQEAKKIEAIQRKILQISKEEDPYDIFICYKETDKHGKRTIDSVFAQEIYEKLIEQNYRVFFAKISLEDKLGKDYEPFIYSALISSKIMLVLGTQKEYFDSPWVRNEWSRFLSLMKNDKDKVLIPLFKTMDGYDLPKEFGTLQAQDLNKVGALQDLMRGIRKVVNPIAQHDTKNTPLTSKSVEGQQGNLTSLLKRAKVFLMDHEFMQASEYAEKMLDIDAEFGEAYLIKMLADFQTTDLEIFSQEINNPSIIKNHELFEKIMRYGSKELIEKINHVLAKITEKEITVQFDQAVALFEKDNPSSLLEAQRILSNLTNHTTSKSLLNKIQKRVIELEEEDIFSQAFKAFQNGTEQSVRQVSTILSPIMHLTKAQNLASQAEDFIIQLHENQRQAKAKELRERYDQALILIKSQTLGSYKKAVYLLKTLGEYEDALSLIDFSKIKIFELQKIANKKAQKVFSIGAAISSFLIVLAGVLFITLPLDVVQQDGVTYSKIGNAYALVSYENQNSMIFNMPNGIRGLPVISISEQAFSGSLVREIQVGYYVQTIHSYAFLNTYQLEKITLSPQTKNFHAHIFFNSSITSLDILHPEAVLYDNVLEGANALTDLTLPHTGAEDQQIKDFFGEASLKLKRLRILYQTHIRSNVFENTSIENLIISSYTQSMEEQSLAGLSDLKQLEIPFVGNNRQASQSTRLSNLFSLDAIPQTLNEVVISDDYQLDPFAFEGISYLKTIIIASQTTRIMSFALTNNPHLETIYIPETVSYVGPSAFIDCPLLVVHLESIRIPDGWNNQWNLQNIPTILGADRP